MTETPAAPTPSSPAAPDDDQLLTELRRVGALADPVPDGWAAAAREAFAWAAVDGEVARLVHDSRSAPDARSGGRLAGSTQRTMRFRAGVGPTSVMLEAELDVGADKVRVTGRIRPPRAVVVAVSSDGPPPVPVDAEGVFRLNEMTRGPFCLLVTGDETLKTEWVVP